MSRINDILSPRSPRMEIAASLPKGFQTAGVHCGIKPDAELLDLALFVSDSPCIAAGVFTQNRVCGAPVQLSRDRVPSDSIRAVVINSGNANTCTGERGLRDARQMTERLANQIGCEDESVLVCSTGVIGHFLPIETILSGIEQASTQLGRADSNLLNSARGMMTTDTVPKLAMREVALGGATARVTGVCKGAAMIAPNMATMLAVIMADAALTTDQADKALRHAVDESFNCISVEGHTSTSDTVLLLANGESGDKSLNEVDFDAIQTAIDEVALELAKSIVADAEGADHTITINVTGAPNREQAQRMARAVANDVLVKTAIAGCDPNWGRIVSCLGRLGIELDERDITLQINDVTIFERGNPVEYDETSLSQQMRAERNVSIDLLLALGDGTARFWTSDLTMEYVRLNSEYTT